MAKGRKKKFALVWWANDGLTSIEDWSSIPGKREIGSMVNLLWKPVDGKTMRLPAKILAIDTSKEKLRKMIVTSSGELHDPMEKIFTASVLQEKKENAQETKVLKNIKKLHKNDLSKRILQDKNIYDMNSNSVLPSATVTSSEYSPSAPSAIDMTPVVSHQNTHRHDGEVDYNSFDDMIHLSSLAQAVTGSIFTTQCSTSTNKNVVPSLESLNTNFVSENLPSILDNFPSPEIVKSQTATPNTANNILRNEEDTTYLPLNNCSDINGDSNSSNRRLEKSVNHEVKKNWENQRNTTNNNYEAGIADDNGNSDDEESSSDIEDAPVRAMAGMIHWEVTERDVAHQELLLKAMKYILQSNQKHKMNSKEKIEIDPVHFKPSEYVEEISHNCQFYLSKAKIAILNLEVAQIEADDERWKALVREVLIEVYGTSLQNYSAKGLRGGRPPIDYRLFKGLYEWAKRVYPNVDKKSYIAHINKTAYNKRKAGHQKTKQQSKRQKTHEGSD